MVQQQLVDRTSGIAVLALVTVAASCWLVAAYLTSKAAPVKFPQWHIESLFPGTSQNPILCLACVVSSNIRAALPLVVEEQQRIRTERDAFNTFITRVQAIDPNQQHSTSQPQQMPVLTSSDTDHNRLQQVRNAYEDTVMAVPHYEEDYGDTVDESLTEEFGEEIAVAVSAGYQFSPPLKHHLLQAATAARQRRTNFLSILNKEEDALDSARILLTAPEDRLRGQLEQSLADLSIDELLTVYNRICDYEQDCETVLKDRQRHRTDGHAAFTIPRSSRTDLQTYLYQSLPATYPVLADGSTLLETLQSTRHQVAVELAWR